MRYALAILPLGIVLALMIGLRWGAVRAGAAGLLATLLVAVAAFGLTPSVLWVSQLKGLLLSAFVLWVMWPALLLYYWINENNGIEAFAKLLQVAVPKRGMCQLLLAWAFSGSLEGIAGFGLPIAVAAPMLCALGVQPVRAVAAVAIGHCWAVTFGDMGVILQTLSAVVSIPVVNLIPYSALLLGFCCLLCGLGAAWALHALAHWRTVAVLSGVMALCQFGVATAGLLPLSAFLAGLSGILAYWLANRGTSSAPAPSKPHQVVRSPALLVVNCYGALLVLMLVLSIETPLRRGLQRIQWQPHFPQVITSTSYQTPAAGAQLFRPLLHPGTLILAVALVSMCLRWRCAGAPTKVHRAITATARAGGLTSAGIILMVGLSSLMDHCGMTFLLAQGLAALLGLTYPVLAPTVGILGAFATGSNNNSNVLFGNMQKNVSLMLGLKPELLCSAQTAGGSLGSMLAPAKIVVGCSTVGESGREGQVLRKTALLGLAAGALVGLLTWMLCLLLNPRT